MTKSQQTHRARYTRRRGSMIVLAIGVLAVLAIVALSYTAAVRVERTGVQAYTARIDSSRQVDAVVWEIQAVLAADLFGNKQADSNTPRLLNPSAPLDAQVTVWPRMFEDGEFFDVPGVDNARRSLQPYTFNDEPLGDEPSSDSVLALESSGSRYMPALSQDDAWLSSTEPVGAPGSSNNEWNTWPTITNLRSTYRWGSIQPGSSNPADFAWVRGDGKFADLAQFFLSEEAGRVRRGDPDADLTDFFDPESGELNGPALGVDQPVFGLQMSAMREFYDGDNPDADEPLPLELSDERFWADADGDLRPDSRWQILDSMGDLQGLKWVVATRIIDNSSMVNVNTALDFGQIDGTVVAPNDPYEAVAAGRSPADVDLLRLLRSAGFRPDLVTAAGESWGDLVGDPNQWDMPEDGPSESTLRYGNSPGLYDTIFQKQHIESQLRLPDLINSWNVDYDNDDSTLDYDALMLVRPLSRYERDRLFGGVGGSYGTMYGLENEVDLRAFWGVNREDTLSELEQRLDAGYLPRQRDVPTEYDDVTGAQLLQGPLRSADRQRHSRGLALTGRVNDEELELRPTFEEIRDDLRRHITTVSGQSYLSPVPVINDAIEPVGAPPQDRLVYGDRAVNLKVAFSDFPATETPGATEAATPSAVARAFEAFTWALAPLATEIPVAAGLTPLDVGGNAADASFHYGGGQNLTNPAVAFPNAGGSPVQASYALLRAASLAVNLADATDRSTLQINPNDPTRDGPTVARLYPVSTTPDGLPTTPTLTALRDKGMPVLTTRFSHGDIVSQPGMPSVSLPSQYVGQPTTGVTLVGLDRQPFLREVAAFAVYRDDLLEAASAPGSTVFDSEIDSTRVEEQLGSIIAFEIGNPWPQPINVRDYKLMLATPDGGRFVELSLSGVANPVIPAGSYAVYYVYRFNPTYQDDWVDVIHPNWRSLVGAKFGAAPIAFEGFDSASATSVRFDAPPAGSVMFQDWNGHAGTETAALIIYDSLDDATDGPVLVDRMSPSPVNTNAFPALLADRYGGTTYTIVVHDGGGGPAGFPAEGSGTGRVGITSSFTRRTRPPTVGQTAGADLRIGGFPAYVIERPEGGNDVSSPLEAENFWSVGTGPFGPLLTVNVSAPGNNLGPGPVGGGNLPKGDLVGMPSIQFFVPNRAFDAVGDLAMLCAFTHMYVHQNDDTPAADWAPAGQFLPAPLELGVPLGDHWVTIGEQLGADMHFLYDGQTLVADSVDMLAAQNGNPYLGVLDPTRFVPGGDLAAPFNLPDSIAIPLAARIYDCFEAVGEPGRRATLAQGRINVNTAPVRTLRMIPFMSPEQAIQSPETPPRFDGSMDGLLDGGTPDAAFQALLTNNIDRAGVLTWYRDATRAGTPSVLERGATLAIDGLRAVGLANRPVDGFVAAGELTTLSFWDASILAAPTPTNITLGALSTAHFGELGQQVDPATRARRNTGVAVTEPLLPAVVPTSPPIPPHVVEGAGQVDGVLDRYPNALMEIQPGVLANLDPIDDAEERTAIYRAMSNIVSTRSDVYTAWFVIRGYDPDRISAISLPATVPNDEELNALMNQLKPTHESRWLAVFDRSNVRLPTDRPKILLLTRLPTR